MKNYHVINAKIEGETVELFGSFDLNDCIYELEANKEQWLDDGYKAIKLGKRLTNEKPDAKVYGKKFCKQFN